METDDQSAGSSPAGGHGDAVRHQVLGAAADILRGAPAVGRAVGDASDQSTVTLYLALLQDRLPVFARVMKDLNRRVGQGEVAGNLAPAARATIGFYTEILAAKVSVFANPDQLMRLRQALQTHDLGPQAAYDAVAGYLAGERALGRIAADVDCVAAARLLLGACVNQAFTRLLLGEAPPDDAYVAQMIAGLRLGHRPACSSAEGTAPDPAG
ncbi:TetR/AcrR family transcriptional regulator C-terminal domain-containing protein [Actinoallomurus purpureus]|uniref:TetR/AcrR family transcriptional regulator C-terminal domain-containing protein n=1 Tax=Actinoallomurus purpureus TaxID=478114 RepID=UPI002092F85F|nr:TetR/AcrR family transcriptional regulator C-terminal domain-containing protein [Actinoallomurus purpureus]MCO6008622.1 TetR/AcrR family transcriptional regulator C-terminal domain-containing protein [Actinoallomurus purpureus]